MALEDDEATLELEMRRGLAMDKELKQMELDMLLSGAIEQIKNAER